MELPHDTVNWGQSASPIDALATIAIAFTSIFVGYYFLSHSKYGKETKYPPYAPGGVWHHTRMRISGGPYWMLDVAQELQTRVIQTYTPGIPPKSLIMVGEASTYRAILTDPLTKKPEKIYRYFSRIYGGTTTMFTLNGAKWHAKRKTVAPAFSPRHIKRMKQVALDKTEAWIKLMAERTTEDEPSFDFDVTEEMVGIVLSALSETAFEYEMSEQEKDVFGKDIELVMTEFILKTPVVPFRSLLGWFIPERRRAVAAAKSLNALSIKIMKEYRAKETTIEGTIIKLIMESDGAFPTDDEKGAQLLGLLIAGRDTTAHSIAFVLIELAKNPNEQTKLRESLSQISPENWATSEHLHRVLKEGMRLNPVGLSIRETGRDILTNKKELIPKGSLCVMHQLMLFRDPNVFSNPNAFAPSRWEEPTREMMSSFHPFSLGKQNCVGQSLARAEVYGIVARVCSEFELSMGEEGIVDHTLTTKPEGTRLRARKVCREVQYPLDGST